MITSPEPVDTATLHEAIIKTLKTIYDPEIPVNIYDLGLIYHVDIQTDGHVTVQMTLTAPGCPVAQTFPGTVETHLMNTEGVLDAKVELVWDPPWDKDKMSEEARLLLGF